MGTIVINKHLRIHIRLIELGIRVRLVLRLTLIVTWMLDDHHGHFVVGICWLVICVLELHLIIYK